MQPMPEQRTAPLSIRKRIDDYIADADFLPPAFQLLPRLLLLLDDLESSAETLAEVVRVDPGLTADILRVCNSAAYAHTYRAETIQDAILRLGFVEVHRIVMTVIASSALKSPHEAYAMHEADLWKHSLACAVSSKEVVQGSGIDPEVAYTTSLLHDVGKAVLANAVPEQFTAATAAAREKGQPLFETERALFQTEHATIGARLLHRWGFPANICAAVQFHHNPAAAGDHVRLASCVYLANILAYRVAEPLTFPRYVVFPETKPLRELGFTQPAFEALAPEARREFQSFIEKFR